MGQEGNFRQGGSIEEGELGGVAGEMIVVAETSSVYSTFKKDVFTVPN